LGVAFCLALAAIGAVVGLTLGHPFSRAIVWAELAGGLVVCAVAALLLLWRPKEAGRTEERESTANVGFRLFLSGALPFGLGLLLSAWLGV
jgi:predicted MFS family arabinose efflux permease